LHVAAAKPLRADVFSASSAALVRLLPWQNSTTL
jgi:hypothetical protein